MRPLVATVTVLTLAAPVQAQSLRSTITDLFTFGDCGAPLCLDLPNAHGTHFIPAVTAGNQTVIAFLTDAIGQSVNNTPISAASSGATFSLVGGLPVRTSTSAGPIFGERSQTLGRGRFFLGANVTSLTFTTLNGTPLDDVMINFTHQDVDPPGLGDPEFENDIIQLRMKLDMSITVMSMYTTVGVTDFLDIGVAVPFVRTSISGSSEAQILPFGSNAVHNFGGDPSNPILRAATAASGSATGLGDIVGRVKINVSQSSSFGAAILTDVRFPSGDRKNLLGSGTTSLRALAVASAQFSNFAPHLNVGYLFRTNAQQNDGLLATLGFDNLMAPWATLAFDLISEWQVGDSKHQLPGDVVFQAPFVRRIPSTSVQNRRNDAVSAALGLKFTVRGGTVLIVNGIAPLRKVGLQPDFIWTAGLEGTF